MRLVIKYIFSKNIQYCIDKYASKKNQSIIFIPLVRPSATSYSIPNSQLYAASESVAKVCRLSQFVRYHLLLPWLLFFFPWLLCIVLWRNGHFLIVSHYHVLFLFGDLLQKQGPNCVIIQFWQSQDMEQKLVITYCRKKSKMGTVQSN